MKKKEAGNWEEIGRYGNIVRQNSWKQAERGIGLPVFCWAK